jgi:hypothetical protein
MLSLPPGGIRSYEFQRTDAFNTLFGVTEPLVPLSSSIGLPVREHCSRFTLLFLRILIPYSVSFTFHVSLGILLPDRAHFTVLSPVLLGIEYLSLDCSFPLC